MQRRQFYDQLGRLVEINSPPQRIISLVPSQTELLHDLQLDEQVVGITKFCIHPPQWLSKPKVGGTKNFWMDAIDKLQPDLIIANKEENYREGVNSLSQKYPVWISDIVSLDDATDMITAIGALTDRAMLAAQITSEIQRQFQDLLIPPPLKVLYLIWKSPWMAAGTDTFIHTMLTKIGLINVINESRYPELSNHEIQKQKPDLVMLSSEPYPFTEKHIAEIRSLLPDSQILLVDGEMFSWYGSRLLKAPGYFSQLPIQLPS